MPNFLIAVAIVVGGIWLIRKFARTPAAAARGLSHKLLGGAIIAVSGFFALRGATQIAVPMFVFGLGLIGKSAAFPNGFPWGQNRSTGQKSRVATSLLEMQLDHDSGGMEGVVLAGGFKGRKLADLSVDELAGFHQQCRGVNDQSLSLLEAWLDRAQPEWRASWGGDARQASAAASPMSREEAFAVLGLKSGASVDDVKTAHKRLMKEFHPDKGGSDYLAAKINAAKDVLLAN